VDEIGTPNHNLILQKAKGLGIMRTKVKKDVFSVKFIQEVLYGKVNEARFGYQQRLDK